MDYNRLKAGDRMKDKRILLGLSKAQVAEKIGRETKYYADIERGSCGMSLKTLIAISNVLDMSIDWILCGKEYGEEMPKQTDEVQAILSIFNNVPEKSRKRGLEVMKIFLSEVNDD